ncbi:MAG: haloacid dehalogenase-like hydrolase [Duncaniella sp.]|nr:haloacid dehalogenase-like hydrolase [Duncaniella sp.]
MTTVIDLDGTLIPENSLQLFGRYLLRELRKRRESSELLRLSAWVTLRKLRLVTHRRAKWEMMRIACKVFSPKDFSDFARGLTKRVRPEFSRLPHPCILATAAPAEYARELARMLGFDGWVATVTTPAYAEYRETRGADKLRNLRALTPPPYHFITDHPDDLPLAVYAEKHGGKVTWVK